ncbi:hypothetical protein BpHYR1_036300 [Brachionus plicatilis]|uniref:Uncharacterized protein n=1 Tax=Brachionus plicatilis TaxID=10195 RepID=A0A3M7SDX8_BRAPC|nr:hypothetical protein BpHYR1_036300 [Brachionus plicatilis]
MDILNSSQHDECFCFIAEHKKSLDEKNSDFCLVSLSDVWCHQEQILKRKYQPKANSNQLNVFYDLTIRTIGYNYFEILYPLIHVLENGLASIDSGHIHFFWYIIINYVHK